jgi:hypothetical protein
MLLYIKFIENNGAIISLVLQSIINFIYKPMHVLINPNNVYLMLVISFYYLHNNPNL